MPEDKALYIVRVEFEFPALLTAEQAKSSARVESIARDAMNDLGDVPFDISEAGPEYIAPDGYETDTLVYQYHHNDPAVTWAGAVEMDKTRHAAK